MRTDPVGEGSWRYSTSRITVDDGAELEVFDWQPEKDRKPPVVIVPGWLTLVESWAPVIRHMLDERRVVYVETREKLSATIPKDRLNRRAFGLDRFGKDLTQVCEGLGFETGRAVFFGSSLGANAILEAMAADIRCLAAFLVGPNAVFDFPAWSYPLLRLPPSAYRALVPFILWNLKHFRLDPKKEPEQVARYERSLAAADFRRLKLGALAVAGYSALGVLERVTDPVAIAFAASDKLHGAEAARRIAGVLPDGRAIECASNHAMHSPEIIDVIDRFVGETSVET